MAPHFIFFKYHSSILQIALGQPHYQNGTLKCIGSVERCEDTFLPLSQSFSCRTVILIRIIKPLEQQLSATAEISRPSTSTRSALRTLSESQKNLLLTIDPGSLKMLQPIHP